jgi:hypothetical protein
MLCIVKPFIKIIVCCPLCPRIINTHLVCSLELLWESFLTFLQTDSILNWSSNSVPRTAALICLLISRPLRVGSLRYELPPLALGRNLQRWTSLRWTLLCIALCHSSIGSAFGKLLVHVGQTMFTIQSLYYLISFHECKTVSIVQIILHHFGIKPRFTHLPWSFS